MIVLAISLPKAYLRLVDNQAERQREKLGSLWSKVGGRPVQL